MENSIQSYENMNHPFPMQTVENQRDQYQLISDEDFFKNMPVGFRFHPSDEELTGYLIQKVRNEPLPPNRIHEVRLYDCSPEFLAGAYGRFRLYQSCFSFLLRLTR
ncbi:hypothetical protein Salat_0956900 [Sesamum alatum]|uniref:NAC domain-containing protein n=1 Tax=Sesamum alatum TaxID=300844 RepID=A0AAE1YL22_9LAMI|nr:hypothetical protein Salat_0956900 [Sesamum alatum]